MLTSTEIFDPATSVFAAGPTMQSARSGHSATVLPDGRILVTGGATLGTAEIFDPATFQFTPTAGNLATPRWYHGSALLQDGTVLIAGGADASSTVLRTAEIFSPATGSFAPLTAQLNAPRETPLVRVLPDGKALIIGGNNESTFELFDPAAQAIRGWAKVLNESNSLADILRAQTRAALIHPIDPNDALLQSQLTAPTTELLDRAGASVTELSGSNQALVAAGANSGGQFLSSTQVVASSAATVTTDRSDYPPGSVVNITGTNWQPGETVWITIHEEPPAYADITYSTVADPQGGFINMQFSPTPADIGRTFTVTTVGGTSDFVAQTSFADACSLMSGTHTIIPNIGTNVNQIKRYEQDAGNITLKWCANSSMTGNQTINVENPPGSGIYTAFSVAPTTDPFCSGTNTSIVLPLAASTYNRNANTTTLYYNSADSTCTQNWQTVGDMGPPIVGCDLVPNSGTVGSTVTVSCDNMFNMPYGGTVQLTNGTNTMTATNVVVTGTGGDGGTFTATFTLTAPTGSWGLKVTNVALGQFGTAANKFTVNADTTPPTVTINQASGQADPTNASPINFTVVFSESVADFATGDVTITGTAGGTKTATVTGSGTTYTVAVTGMTTAGTVIASIAAGVATDAAGNGNTASTNTDNTVTYDATAPTVTINQAGGQADPTSVSPINFTVVFSEGTTNFATGDVTIGGTAGGTKTGTVTGSGTTYNVAVTGMTTSGTVIASIAAGVATDAAGNQNTASTSIDNTVSWVLDTTAPTVFSINRVTATPTNLASVQWTVVFSESVTGVDSADFSLAIAGLSGTSITGVSGSGTTYTVTASTGSGNGSIGLNLVDDDTIVDGAGNKLGGAGTGNGNFTGQVYTVDKTAPTVTINQAAGQADPTSASPINFTVVFTEATTNFATGDVTITGTAGGTKTATVTGSGTTYNVAVTGMTTAGTVIASIAAGVAPDAAGNAGLLTYA